MVWPAGGTAMHVLRALARSLARAHHVDEDRYSQQRQAAPSTRSTSASASATATTDPEADAPWASLGMPSTTARWWRRAELHACLPTCEQRCHHQGERRQQTQREHNRLIIPSNKEVAIAGQHSPRRGRAGCAGPRAHSAAPETADTAPRWPAQPRWSTNTPASQPVSQLAYHEVHAMFE